MTEERIITIGTTTSQPEGDPVKPTPRLALQSVRADILSALYIDLRVPRWPNEIWVRYGPVKSAKVNASLTRHSANEHETDEATLLVYADLLVNSCVGVYQTLDGDFSKKYALRLLDNGEPDTEPTTVFTRFDQQLGHTLGLTDFQAQLATNNVRALYITDGDLIEAAQQVSNWSTKASEEAEKTFSKP